jgi:hypothetical protein
MLNPDPYTRLAKISRGESYFVGSESDNGSMPQWLHTAPQFGPKFNTSAQT